VTDSTTDALDTLDAAIPALDAIQDATVSRQLTAAEVLRVRAIRAALLERLHDIGCALPPYVAPGVPADDDDEDTSDPDTVPDPVVVPFGNPTRRFQPLSSSDLPTVCPAWDW